jgi:hypothetical protein
MKSTQLWKDQYKQKKQHMQKIASKKKHEIYEGKKKI